MTLGQFLLWSAIPFVCAPSHLDDLKVKRYITNRRITMETELLLNLNV